MGDDKEGLGLGDVLFLLFGAAVAYKIYKGNVLSLLFMPFMIIGFAILFLIVFISLLQAFAPLIVLLILIVCGGYLVTHPSESKPQENKEDKSAKTDRRLSEVYMLAMKDLEDGKITDEEFLKVAGKVRKYREIIRA